MMRISSYELHSIRTKILEDLYSTLEAKIVARQDTIVQKNRDLWLAKYQPLLDQLPESMVTREREYKVSINFQLGKGLTKEPLSKDQYPDNRSFNDHGRYYDFTKVYELWTYRFESKLVNPKDNYEGEPLHPDLYPETAQLCEEILKLRKEKEEMKDYLIQTMRKYTGSKQLKKVWDESLHKYLPAEPVKGPRKAKVEPETVPTPDFLKTRMTTNLLEGN